MKLIVWLALLFLTIPSFGEVPSNCLESLNEISRQAVDPKIDLSDFARSNFNLFVIAQLSKSNLEWWKNILQAATSGDQKSLVNLFADIPVGQRERALRFLVEFSEHGGLVPGNFKSEVEKAKIKRNQLRSKDVKVTRVISRPQEVRLTNILSILGIRRSKINRIYHRTKEYLGLKSSELIPIIKADDDLNILGDEARFILNRFNTENISFENLLDDLFDLYTLRVYEPYDEPWFKLGNQNTSLFDFVNQTGYRKTELQPDNKWQLAGRLRPENVQNPFMKGMLTREVWWNRLKGINPIGSVRIARNMKVESDGKENIVSVEILNNAKDGYFVPYIFTPDAAGVLRAETGHKARITIESCFVCHVRVSGIFMGGISLPNAKHIPSIDWKINGLDRVFAKDHGYFKELKK